VGKWDRHDTEHGVEEGFGSFFFLSLFLLFNSMAMDVDDVGFLFNTLFLR
jgi:hypothetical protein